MFGMVLSLMMSIGWAEIDLNDAGVEDFMALDHIDQSMLSRL